MARQSGGAACSPTCTLGGSFVLNNSTGAIRLPNITMAGESPNVGPFITFPQGFAPGNGSTSLQGTSNNAGSMRVATKAHR
jgi:hypothetical protein